MRGKPVRKPRNAKRGAGVKKRRPRKPVARTDRATQAWKRSWQSYLNREMSSAEIVDAAIEHWKKQIQASEESAKELDGAPRRPRNRFVAFERNSRSDLVHLIERGANPCVIIALIVLDDAWHPLGIAHILGKREREAQGFSPPAFWRRVAAPLRRAQRILKQEFESSNLYHMSSRFDTWSEDDERQYPFIRLFKELSRTRDALEKVVRTIDELGVTEKNRRLFVEGHFVRVEKTERGGGRRGRIKKYDWERSAFALWRYLTKRTGQPQWPSIVRLLYHAGYVEFRGAVPQNPDAEENSPEPRTLDDDMDKIRKRVNNLRRSIGDGAFDLNLAQFEEDLGSPQGGESFREGWVRF